MNKKHIKMASLTLTGRFFVLCILTVLQLLSMCDLTCGSLAVADGYVPREPEFDHVEDVKSMRNVTTANSSQKQAGQMWIILEDDGTNVVVVDGAPWFRGTQPFIRAYQRTFSVTDGTLVLETEPPFGLFEGVDDLGPYIAATLTYVTVGAGSNDTADGELRLECTVQEYNWEDGDALVFTQKLPEGAPDAVNLEDFDGVVTSYPGFFVGWNSENVELGFLSTGGHMLGQSNIDLARWQAGTYKIHGGESGGILAVFDKNGDNSVVMSPLDNFMRTNMFRDYDNEAISFGVMGGVKDVPKGYTSKTILVRSSGIRDSIAVWGRALRRHHGVEVSHVSSDLSVSHLGYWTDNGAYYYYATEDDMNYEETVATVVDYYAQEIEVPIKYFQIDSWWYYKGILDGVKNWTERPDIFPNGLKDLRDRIDMPIVAHNRYFSPDTVYAQQNGGAYDFVVEDAKALPTSRKFWDDLLDDAMEWGLIVYEQDWLDRTFMDMEATHTDLDLATNWLAQMHDSAEERGINIQYCMALTRFGLESVKHPRVTQIRVSEDYAASMLNWKIGISSMIAHALGKAPFKDTFRTDLPSIKQLCGQGTYGLVDVETCTKELHPALHGAISTLSTGPVGPGDRIGTENASLIKKSCRSDGKLLKPDHPAMAINGQLLRAAFGVIGDSAADLGPKGEVWSTTVTYQSQGLTFGIIFVADLKEAFELALDKSGANVNGLNSADGSTFIYRLSDHEELAGFMTLNPGEKLSLEPTSSANYSYIWYTSPVIQLSEVEVEVVVLGEMAKWVPVSQQRTRDIHLTDKSIEIYLEGSEGETIEYTIGERPQNGGPVFEMVNIECSFGASGEARLLYPEKTCG